MTDQLKEIKRMHDIIKSDPFWITFDKSLYYDLLMSIRSLNNIIYDCADETNPYYVIWKCMYHDFMAMWCTEISRLRDGYEGNIDSEVILVLQTYLTIVHSLFEERDYDDIIGYTCVRKNGKYHLSSYKALYDEDKKEYYAAGLVDESQRDFIIKLCEDLKSKAHSEESKKWYDDALDDLHSGKKLINKCWLFKD